MTGWDYAQLSHLAKELGGPEALIANIRNGGLATGRWQGGIIGAATTIVVGGLGAYLYDRHKKKLVLADQSAEILASNIKAYDVKQAGDELEEGEEGQTSIQDDEPNADETKS